MPVRHTLAALGLVGAALIATPAYAQDSETIDYEPTLPEVPQGTEPDAQSAEADVPQSAGSVVTASTERAPLTITRYSAEQREGWLAQCRDRMRIPEGATVRTATGQADDGWNAARYCEDYLNRYEAAYVRAIETAYANRNGVHAAQQVVGQSASETAAVD